MKRMSGSMKKVIVGVLVLSMTGCFSYQVTPPPPNYNESDRLLLSNQWIRENKDSLAEQLVDSIKENHPRTADWFPNVNILSIDVEEEPRHWSRADELKEHLNDIFEMVISDLYGDIHEAQEVDVALRIREASPDINPALYAVLIPYGVACMSTLMMICPLTGRQVMVAEGTFSQDEEEIVTLSGAGASRRFMLSPYADDSPQWHSEAETKALIAALVQLTDNFVEHIERQHDI